MMLLITLIVSLISCAYIIFDQSILYYTVDDWFYTFISIIGVYFLIPLILGRSIIKRAIDRKRFRLLPTYLTLSVIPGYILWIVLFSFPESLPSPLTSFPVISFNIILILFYAYFVFPLFLNYMFSSVLKKSIMRDNFVYSKREPGVSPSKIWQKLLVMALLISLFPVLILYIDGYVNFDPTLDSSRRALSNMDVSLVVISVIITIYIVTKDLTDPIYKLVKSFKEIEKGNLGHRIPVTTNNEMGVLIDHFNSMADALEEREKIKNFFTQYVSPQVANEIMSNENIVSGEEREVTVLFTDIEDYTKLSESLSPGENIEVLNSYYEVLIKIVKKYGGVVNKFMGDAIMAIFNAPHDDPDHYLNGFSCAQEIVEKTRTRKFAGHYILKTRVGINSGQVLAGRVGALNRYEYTIIGDTVNIAQKLEQFNKVTNTQILLSHNTACKIFKKAQLKHIGKSVIKGKSERVRIYTPV